MFDPSNTSATSSADIALPADPPAVMVNPFEALAAYIHKAADCERAVLARLCPDQPLRRQDIATLAQVLLSAGLQPRSWCPDTWACWTRIARRMALARQGGAGAME